MCTFIVLLNWLFNLVLCFINSCGFMREDVNIIDIFWRERMVYIVIGTCISEINRLHLVERVQWRHMR